MRIYRICPTVYADDPFSGKGGLYGEGRWHTRGSRISYASTEAGTAALEVLVNTASASALDVEQSLIVASLPDELLERLPLKVLPPGWDTPVYGETTQAIGDRWFRDRASLALLVPSATLKPPPLNVLVNPDHAAIDRLVIERVEPFVFDERIRTLLAGRGVGRSDDVR